MNKSVAFVCSNYKTCHSSRIWTKTERIQHITIHSPDVLVFELFELNGCVSPFFRRFETLEHCRFLNHYSMPRSIGIIVKESDPYAF